MHRYLVSLLAVFALALVACGGDDDKGTTAQRREVPTTIATSTTTKAPTAVDAASLEQFLIADVPAGFVRQADDVGDTGPSDLEKAIRDDGEDDARAVLTKAGFLAGYQRLWVNAADDELIVFLYQFKDGAGAGSYQDRTLAGAEDATAFNVAGVPSAKGLQHVDSELASTAVFYTKGPYLVQIISNASAPAGQTDVVTRLAAAQYQRLPGTVA